MSAIAFHIAAATHKMAQGSMMISRFKTLKGERFASREESATWDRQLHSLSHHFQQRDALFRRVASLCSRFEVVPANPRELDESEQDTVEPLQQEMVDALSEYWHQDARLRSTELWIELLFQGRDNVADDYAYCAPM
jgi:hypothetical protein